MHQELNIGTAGTTKSSQSALKFVLHFRHEQHVQADSQKFSSNFFVRKFKKMRSMYKIRSKPSQRKAYSGISFNRDNPPRGHDVWTAKAISQGNFLGKTPHTDKYIHTSSS